MEQTLTKTNEEILSIEAKIQLARKPIPPINIIKPILACAGNPIGLRAIKIVEDE